MLMGFGRLLGALAWRLARSRRRVVEENLRLAFPELSEQERKRLARRNLIATGVALAEHLAAWFRPRLPAGLARIEGLERLSGQGPVLLLSGHFLPLELAARLLAEASGERYHLLARPYRPSLERLIRRGRTRYAASVIAKDDARSLLRLLRAGPGLFYAPDQRGGARAPKLSFFGIEAPSHVATAKLAARAGARVLLFSFRREADGRYRLRLEAADWPLADPIGFTKAYLAWLETRIREAPEQYLWAHRRFRDAGGGPYSRAALRRKHR
jgi:KDO2-lipid IV(A) lauroyltransferase